MNDLEQRLRAEFSRQALPTPDPAATEAFALGLIGTRAHRRLHWLIPAVAALVLIVPILTVLAIHRHKTATPAGATTDPKAIVGIEWLLTRSVDANGTSHPAPTGTKEQVLQLDANGAIGFNQDCNYASGRVKVSAGQLVSSNVSVTLMGCGSGDNAMSLLGDGKLSWSVDHQVLTIIGSGHRKLIFVVRPSIYPLDYPGSPNVTVLEGKRGTADYRVSYVPVHANTVYAKLEWRAVPGGFWSQNDWQAATTGNGPLLAGTNGCQPADVSGQRYLVGWASARVARVTASSTNGAMVNVALHKLAGTGGLQLYAGFIGPPASGSTLSIFDAQGTLLGKPCSLRE